MNYRIKILNIREDTIFIPQIYISGWYGFNVYFREFKLIQLPHSKHNEKVQVGDIMDVDINLFNQKDFITYEEKIAKKIIKLFKSKNLHIKDNKYIYL